MNVFVVYCHPSAGSFTSEVRHEFLRGLAAAGHRAEVSDLYAMEFRTDMDESEYSREAFYRCDLPVPADVNAEQEKIQRCDAIVFIYPVFWTEAPAKLVGWFDRVWTYGFAYGERAMKKIPCALALCVAGRTKEHLEQYGHLESMRRVMLGDRIFDRAERSDFAVLDGTLWDSTDVCIGAWHEAIGSLPYVTSPVTLADLQGVMGLHHSLIGARLFPYLDAAQRAEVMERCYAQEIEAIRRTGGKIYSGVEDVLEELSSRFRLFIVSNCQSGYIEAFHSYHHLERLFTDWECSGDTGLSKAENIRLVMERNALSMPVYVGDTKGDADAAKECGVPFVFASYGFGNVESPDAVMESFDELKDLL